MNGFLGSVDYVSFHTYGERKDSPRHIVPNYRTWLEKFGKLSMPLWITEAKFGPGVNHPPRPPIANDMNGALESMIRVIQSRAYGVTRHFPFKYVYVAAKGIMGTKAMMGLEGTPLREMAAYCQCIRVLSNKAYVGDLRLETSQGARTMVFSGGRQAVVIVYTGKPDPEAAVRLGVPPNGVEGIDGRVLRGAGDDTIPVPDGIAYVFADTQDIAGRIDTNTDAAKFYAIAQQPRPRRPKPSPVILQHIVDMQPGAEFYKPFKPAAGYIIPREQRGDVPLKIRVTNLGERPAHVRIEFRLPTGAVIKSGAGGMAMTVPALHWSEFSLRIDLSGCPSEEYMKMGNERILPLAVSAESKDIPEISPLVIPLLLGGG